MKPLSKVYLLLTGLVAFSGSWVHAAEVNLYTTREPVLMPRKRVVYLISCLVLTILWSVYATYLVFVTGTLRVLVTFTWYCSNLAG